MHTIDDPLTEATALDVVEYPTPRGFASKDKADENSSDKFQDLPIIRVLSAFPEQIILMDPPAHIHVCGSSVNTNISKAGHDIDVLVKQSFPDKRLIQTLTTAIRERDPEVANRIHWVFDPHGPQVGYCFDQLTEILTKDGWKLFRELESTDEVLTLNPESKETSYEIPIEIETFNFNGKMINLKNKTSVDSMVTPNHRLFVLDRKTLSGKFIQADSRLTHHYLYKTIPWKGKKQRYFILPEYSKIWDIKHIRNNKTWFSVHKYLQKERAIPMKDWLKFFGFWMTEGWTTSNGYVGIAQNPGSISEEIQQSIRKLGYYYRTDKTKSGCLQFKIKNKQLWSYLHEFGKAHNKHIPSTLLQLPPEDLKILKDSLLKGDGHLQNNWRFYTCSKQLADDMQILMLKTGKTSQVKFRENRNQFEVFESNDNMTRLRKEIYKESSYSGKVYCVTTRNGVVFTRRNGKVCWSGNSVPMYRLAYVKVPPNEWGKHSPWEYLSDIALGKPIRSLKSGTGYNKFEFFDADSLWNNWAASRIEKGIVIQKKFDGMRIQIHRKGNKVWCFTEDRQRDRADVFKKSIAELLKNFKADNFIIDSEMVWYDCQGKDTKDKEYLCIKRPREEMIPWITSSKMNLDDEDIVFHVHDCMMYDGQDMTQKPYTERLAAVDKIIPKGLYHFKAIPGYEVHDKRSFDRILAKVRRLPGSEGAMLKQVDSTYKLTGRTTQWAKIKNVKEIDVMVWDVVPKKDSKTGKIIQGQYMYDCVISVPCSMKDKIKEDGFKEWKGKCYYLMGRTYSTAVKCNKGDILAVRPIRVAQFQEKGKIYWTWMFPTVKARNPNKTEPDGLDVVKKLIAAGTAPLSTLSEEVVKLPTCPFYEDVNICPLKSRFARTMDDLSRRQYLKFPIACSLAYYWKCRYVKPYYYDYLIEPETDDEVKEDNGCSCNKVGEQQ
jgi:hypothetical protein